MTKRKKLAKKALKKPEMFSPGELAYFQRWLEEHRAQKALLKKNRGTEPSNESLPSR